MQKHYDKTKSFETVNKENEQEFSKYLSYLLRHNPADVGLELLEDGWINTHRLIKAINDSDTNKYIVALYQIIDIVKNDNKQRYSFKSEDNDEYAYIRANQGHSIKGLKINFKLVETPPEYLYHGTSDNAAQAILDSGVLLPMSRQMVHLSKDIETATNVGKRHGKVAIFKVDTKKAIKEGKRFYISENGVYLVDMLRTDLIELI